MFDKRQKANDDLGAVIWQLQRLADAFSITGNHQVCKQLNNLANLSIDAQENFEQSHNELFNTYFKATEQASVNMINAALAGIEIATREQ